MPDTTDFEPHVLGPYFVLEPLARGEVAHVYRARATGAAGFQREIVLKKVLPQLAGNPEFLDMLAHEAKLTSQLHHGNIAQVFDLALVDGELLLTMEYVDGITYGEFLSIIRASGQVPAVSEVCHVIAEACAALDYAHRKTDGDGAALGIVHCDLSPENLMLSLEGVVKVLDFGLARVAERFGMPGSGSAAGLYAAPEQIAGDDLDARADVYACGVLLYEGLSGVHPFPAGSDRGRAPPSLTGTGEEVPQPLDAVVQRALSFEPARRQPSCRHLAAELSAFVGEPALAATALSRSLRARLASRLPQRRAQQARDELVVAELRRRSAVGPGASTIAQHARIDLPAPAARPQRRWPSLVLGLAAGALASTAVAPLLAGAPPATAVVTADVPGATVRVDRTPRGKVPLELRGLVAGKPLLVEVEAPGRPVYSHTFAPTAGSLTVVAATLAGRTGSLRVETDPPGARLLVDGREVGRTPVTAEHLAVGVPHRFRLELEGTPPQEFMQVIGEDEPAPLRIALPQPGTR